MLLLAPLNSAQAQEIRGTVVDEVTNETLPGVNVVIEGTVQGTATRGDGTFSLRANFDAGPVTIVASFIGYNPRRIVVDGPTDDLVIRLRESRVMGDDIVVSASRREERIMEAPVTIERVDARQISNLTSPDLYTGLAHLKGIDLNTSSMLFTTINTRGFNSAKPERIIQLNDYADTQIPSLNFTAGNLNGIHEIDIESVEIIHGPASALYGANAFNGVINIISKDPFLHPGITAQVRGGERELFEGAIRVAQPFLDDRLGVKIVASYFQADDWVASNMDPQFTSLYGADDIRRYDAVNMYGDIALNFAELLAGTPNAPIGNAIGTVYMPGFTEEELVDDNTARNFRFVGNAQYLLTDNLKLSYEYKYASGSATYQSTSRYRFDNFQLQTHKAELSSDDFMIRAYTIADDSGDTYDLTFYGAFLNQQVAPQFVQTYAQAFASVFTQPGATHQEAHEAAFNATQNSRFDITDPANAELRDTIRENAIWFDADGNPQLGAGFNVASRINHVEGQYNFDIDRVEVTAGASYRQFQLNSDGSLFEDEPDETIDNYEYGFYAQAGISVLDERLRFLGALRYDDFRNFDGAFSPRISAVYSLGDRRQHNFRVAFQSAFRSPTQLDQYIQLDIGQLILLGNIRDGFQGFDLASVQAGNPQPISIAPLKTEQVRTFETGYKGIILDNLYLDTSFYINWYEDFIGAIRFIDGSTNRPTQVWTNAQESVRSTGFSAGLNYYFMRELNFMGSYTYSHLDASGVTDPIIPAFNTPEHKFSLGVNGQPFRNFNYNVNLRWSEEHRYEMPFAEGIVPSYYTIDAQVNYRIPDYYTTIKVGATNITDNQHIQTYGSPTIGRMVFTTLTFEF